jgi:hypothetical protein
MRPEDKTGLNPVYTIDPQHPGSDIAAAMSAALGAASVIFKDADPAYSQALLAAALKAYAFATRYVGSYNAAVPDAAAFYPSTNMYDDMAWAAVWLAVRTGDPSYKAKAKEFYSIHWRQEPQGGPIVWNNYGGKHMGALPRMWWVAGRGRCSQRHPHRMLNSGRCRLLVRPL